MSGHQAGAPRVRVYCDDPAHGEHGWNHGTFERRPDGANGDPVWWELEHARRPRRRRAEELAAAVRLDPSDVIGGGIGPGRMSPGASRHVLDGRLVPLRRRGVPAHAYVWRCRCGAELATLAADVWPLWDDLVAAGRTRVSLAEMTRDTPHA